MYTSKQIFIPSSVTALQTLRVCFDGRLEVLEPQTQGSTACKIVLDHIGYLQNLGVPPDPDHARTLFLNNNPFLILLDLVHPGNEHKFYTNGRVVDYFVGPSSPIGVTSDCRATLAYRLGFTTVDFSTTPRPKMLSPASLTPSQHRLLSLVDHRLEELLTTSTAEKQ